MKKLHCACAAVALFFSFSFVVSAQTLKMDPKPDQKQDTRDRSALSGKRVQASMGTDGVQRIEILGGEYYFDPDHIIIKINKPVELIVRKGKDASKFIPHNMIVKAPEAGMDFTIDLKKEPQTIRFTATKTGLYPMYCDKKPLLGKSHKEKGMHGMIEVVE
ncbi:MAG: quinol oxidase [Nitrospirota bacterium]